MFETSLILLLLALTAVALGYPLVAALALGVAAFAIAFDPGERTPVRERAEDR